jgi:soluble lytic murein transglycosylase-like protein
MAFPTTFKLVLTALLAISAVGMSAISPSLELQIQDAARRASLDPRLVRAVIKVESNFKKDAVSPKGATGLMQMMSQTAEECEITDRTHELNHLMGACLCLRKLINRYRGNLKLALAAYNAGPSAVARYKGVPPFPETQKYVEKVLRFYRHP